ncbi:DNA-directed RNA polymerase I subunit RPA2 [Eumeta japonica]|uniref:DNA-directed RNA polymerase n=1 Tax=Eumeta variegata TaxID=151549 RepID=A0A4C1TZ23_EUMVA|nr:DNA-directed RNA polymerase I subunit RPA2 [Eumeta japonica]
MAKEDQLGVVYYELLDPTKTITGTLYRPQLMRLSRALKEKLPQYYSRHNKIILLHDSAHPHVADPVKNYLKTFDWEVLPHPPYSLDIAPSDYRLSRSMAHALSEQRSTSNEDTKKLGWYFDGDKNYFSVVKYHGKEEVFVDSVRLCGDFNTKAPPKACVVLRIQRNPMVGDKFASRAGQKGICSQKWAAEDLPFTESGLIPDVLFNPHGFPSRMTIAMMIECMAGKSASLHGEIEEQMYCESPKSRWSPPSMDANNPKVADASPASWVHDATPFRFNERDTAINYFGRLLEAGGYNYYGTERMYSGVDGREMSADIFFGVIHYQRLRHMVSDKWQVRTTGAVDVLTRQPVRGRKRGGGVRLGEMERDGLMSHGASFLLHERLFHCSDKTEV